MELGDHITNMALCLYNVADKADIQRKIGDIINPIYGSLNTALDRKVEPFYRKKNNT